MSVVILTNEIKPDMNNRYTLKKINRVYIESYGGILRTRIYFLLEKHSERSDYYIECSDYYIEHADYYIERSVSISSAQIIISSARIIISSARITIASARIIISIPQILYRALR